MKEFEKIRAREKAAAELLLAAEEARKRGGLREKGVFYLQETAFRLAAKGRSEKFSGY